MSEIPDKYAKAIKGKEMNLTVNETKAELEIFFDRMEFENGVTLYEKSSLTGCVYMDNEFGKEETLKTLFSSDFIQCMVSGYLQDELRNWDDRKERGEELPDLEAFFGVRCNEATRILYKMRQIEKELNEPG